MTRDGSNPGTGVDAEGVKRGTATPMIGCPICGWRPEAALVEVDVAVPEAVDGVVPEEEELPRGAAVACEPD